MGLTVACMTSYCSSSSHEVTWSDDAYGAAAFKNAIKGHTINRPQYVLVRRQWLQISDATKSVALDWFVDMAQDFLSTTTTFAPGQPGPVVLIPLPGSKLVPGAVPNPHSPHTMAMKLAARLAQNGQAALVADVLRWKQPMRNTHGEGGSREAEELYSDLMVTSPVPPGRLLLVDDVLTGGGHMQATAYVLKKLGVQVAHGLCAVKAEAACPKHCFQSSTHTFGDFVPMAELFGLG